MSILTLGGRTSDADVDLESFERPLRELAMGIGGRERSGGGVVWLEDEEDEREGIYMPLRTPGLPFIIDGAALFVLIGLSLTDCGADC